jgi:hypothetical protein
MPCVSSTSRRSSPVNFDDTTGRNVGLEYPVQIRDGKPVIVFPEEAAGADPVYPVSYWGN